MINTDAPLQAEMGVKIVDPDDGPITRTVAFGVPDGVTLLVEITKYNDRPPYFELTVGGVSGDDPKVAIGQIAQILAHMANSTAQYAAEL